MKIKTLFFAFLLFPFFANAQVYSYDFGTYSTSYISSTYRCASSPTSNYSGGCTSYGWSGLGTSSYFTTSAISLPINNTITLSFNYKYSGFSSYPTVLVSTSTCSGTFTTVSTLNYQYSCGSTNVDLSSYAGQTVYIKFQSNSSSYSFILDDIVVTATPAISGTSLWSQDFTTTSYDMGSNSSFTRNAGGSYACTLGDYVFYTSSSNARFQTNTFSVPQNKGVKLTFDSYRTSSSAGNIKIYYNITGYCSFDYSNPNNNGWVKWGEITPNTGTGTGNCTTQSMSLESFICGGQDMSVCLWCPNASNTYRISIDNIDITDGGPTTVPTPVIVGATQYTENFTTDRWYGPVSDSWYSATGVVMPYKSRKSASDCYVYLWNNGANGMGNHTGTWSDYYAGFYTGFDFCGTTGGSQMITKELNTSTCASAQVKYAWKSLYPCGGGANYDYTFDEDYTMYAPDLYTSTGQGYTWVQQGVNYYFPDGLWHYASYSVPSAANIKVRFERGGFCTNPVEGVDEIKVFCRDCSISALSGGTITGESNPLPSTDYTYNITPTAGATYYKWMVRAIDRTPTEVIEAACPNGNDPCIVSGQGTTSCTINFGTTNENFRVMCIPFDANPGSLAFPSDACYAEISLFPTSPLPVEWGYFKIKSQNDDVLLEWQTLSETNCDRFEVEKSTDEINFHTTHTTPGAGNTSSPQYYSWLDDELMSGTTYYRIKQIDFNGDYSYSQILSVISENPEQGIEINTVFNNSLHISTMLDILYPLQIDIYDMQGRIVKTVSNFKLSAGGSTDISTSDMNDGIYLLRIYGIGVDKKVKIVKSGLVE
jgi:hypothetical protein